MRHLIDDAVITTLTKTLRNRSVQAQVSRAIDDALSRAPVQVEESIAALRASKRKAQSRMDRLVACIADGTLQPAEASSQMEAARRDVADADSRIEVQRFRGQGMTGTDQRERLLSAMTGFGVVASRVQGPELRALIEPWIAGAEFDKVTRRLTLRIWPVSNFLLHSQPGPASQINAIVRRVDLSRRVGGALYGISRRKAG
jgi:hypothetical protein